MVLNCCRSSEKDSSTRSVFDKEESSFIFYAPRIFLNLETISNISAIGETSYIISIGTSLTMRPSLSQYNTYYNRITTYVKKFI